MENRFGFRDLIFCALLLAVIVTLFLGMRQTDRQWDQIRTIHQKLTDQAGDLGRMSREARAATADQTETLRRELEEIRLTLERGVAVGPGAGTGGEPEAGSIPATQGGPAATRLAATAPASTQAARMGPVQGDKRDPFARVQAATTQPGYAAGDWYVDVFSVAPKKLTPLVSGDSYGAQVQGYIFESLATRDPVTLDWMPLLAKSWRVSEDGLIFEFQMRPEATFSDGEPVTADDVIFTYQWTMNEAVEAPRQRAYLKKVASVEKLGRHGVRFRLSEPYFEAFELTGGMSILPQHFYRQFSPTEFNRSVALLLGSGPYRFEDPKGWTPDKPVVLVRNERYWGPPAPFDRILYRVIENETARLTTFRNGDIDLFPATPEQYKELLKDESVLARTNHFEYFSAAAGYRFIGWNQVRGGKPTVFADKRVRQAMTYLADRQKIVDEILLGYSKVADGPFNPLSKQHAPDVQPLPFDPERGKKLLAEAGCRDTNGDGVIETPDGQPFRFKIMYPGSSDVYNKFILLLTDGYKRTGLLLEPEPTEWNVMLERLETRDFDACCLGWTAGIESDPYQIFHSSQIEGTADNFVSYRNAEVDKLIETARATVDPEKRMPLWHNVQRLLHEDQPYLFMTVSKSLLFLDNRIANVQKVTLGLNPDVEWYVPADRQKYQKKAPPAPR